MFLRYTEFPKKKKEVFSIFFLHRSIHKLVLSRFTPLTATIGNSKRILTAVKTPLKSQKSILIMHRFLEIFQHKIKI